MLIFMRGKRSDPTHFSSLTSPGFKHHFACRGQVVLPAKCSKRYNQNMIKTDGLLKELVGFESILLFSVIANTAQKKIHNKTAPSVWIAVLLLIAQSIPTSGWKMLFDFPLWYRHLIGNRCLSQNIFVSVTTPPSRAPLFIADCALVSLQGLAHLMMGDQGMGSVPFPLCFHCFFLFCSCFESITATDGQMLESCLWLQRNTWF